jgi:hypothetical protein
MYQLLYGVTYLDDLKAIGAEPIGGHLARIQDARNRFVHGDSGALSDAVVEAVVRNLKIGHDAWTGIYNRRLAALLKQAAVEVRTDQRLPCCRSVMSIDTRENRDTVLKSCFRHANSCPWVHRYLVDHHFLIFVTRAPSFLDGTGTASFCACGSWEVWAV